MFIKIILLYCDKFKIYKMKLETILKIFEKHQFNERECSFFLEEDIINIAKEIAEYEPKTDAVEAITLFNFYQKESCEIVNGLRLPVRQEYLEQYKTIESWLKNKHNDYKVIDNN